MFQKINELVGKEMLKKEARMRQLLFDSRCCALYGIMRNVLCKDVGWNEQERFIARGDSEHFRLCWPVT